MRKLYGLIECCLNWRVVVGLAFAGTALFLYAPQLALASLPVLVVLVCPISMLFMILSMRRMNMRERTHEESEPGVAFQNRSREQQLQLLEERMERVQMQRRAIAIQLPALERHRAHAEVAGGNGKVDSQPTIT